VRVREERNEMVKEINLGGLILFKKDSQGEKTKGNSFGVTASDLIHFKSCQ